MSKSKAKVLVLDIENSYIHSGVWGLWGVNLGIDQIIDSGKVLCYAAKWLGKKEIMFRRHDDEDFLTFIYSLLDDADMVLTFNGRKHDIPLLNREMVKAGMRPPSPYRHIDLLETAKKQFKFPSNKMQQLLTELGLPKKIEHEGFTLWTKVLSNDDQAWATMKKYNVNDVKVLERLYKRILPWIANHPNLNLFSTESCCAVCGSHNLESRGSYVTNTGRYRRLRCRACGHWNRGRYTEVSKEDRQKIVVSAV